MRARSFLGLCLVGVAGCSSKTEQPAAQPPAPDAAKTAGTQPRRMVKTATDPDASKIDTAPKDTTVEDIVAQKKPSDISGRVGPFETTTWRVKATLESVQLMKDGDYYLVLKGSKGGETVVEVPDPAQCTGSPLAPQIATARKEIEDRYHPTPTLRKVNQQATVTGVGFLGWGSSGGGGKKKGAGGHTGARLMPGTGFDFGS